MVFNQQKLVMRGVVLSHQPYNATTSGSPKQAFMQDSPNSK